MEARTGGTLLEVDVSKVFNCMTRPQTLFSEVDKANMQLGVISTENCCTVERSNGL